MVPRSGRQVHMILRKDPGNRRVGVRPLSAFVGRKTIAHMQSLSASLAVPEVGGPMHRKAVAGVNGESFVTPVPPPRSSHLRVRVFKNIATSVTRAYST